jgi:hypothetical protein
MFTDFLGGTSNVKLDVEMKPEKLNKFYVQIMLDEPSEQIVDIKPAEMQPSASEELLLRSSVPSIRKARRRSMIQQGGDEAPKSPDGNGSHPDGAANSHSASPTHIHGPADEKTSDAQEEEELSMAALSTFPDNEEGAIIPNMVYEKMDFHLTPEEVISQYELSRSRLEGFSQGNDDDSEYTPLHQDGTGSDAGGGGGGGVTTKGSSEEEKWRSLPNLSKSAVETPPSPKAKSSHFSSTSGSAVVSARFPPLPGSREGDKRKNETGTLKKTKNLVSNPDKKFEKLLVLIHKSRDASRKNKVDTRSVNQEKPENVGVEAVIGEWRKFSQF